MSSQYTIVIKHECSFLSSTYKSIRKPFDKHRYLPLRYTQACVFDDHEILIPHPFGIHKPRFEVHEGYTIPLMVKPPLLASMNIHKGDHLKRDDNPARSAQTSTCIAQCSQPANALCHPQLRLQSQGRACRDLETFANPSYGYRMDHPTASKLNIAYRVPFVTDIVVITSPREPVIPITKHQRPRTLFSLE